MTNQREQLYAAIDIGTTKVVTLVARTSAHARVDVVAKGHAASIGMRKGMIVSPDAMRDSIQASVREAEQALGGKLPPAAVGVTGAHLRSKNIGQSGDLTNKDGSFTESNVEELMETIGRGPVGMSVIQTVPRSPVEAHVVMGDAVSIDTLKSTLAAAGVATESIVPEHLASSEAVLNPDERVLGVVLADIGGGSTDIAVYREGSVWLTETISIAGQHFTTDVATGLGLLPAAAESVKIINGSVWFQNIAERETLEARPGLSRSGAPIRVKKLNQLLHDRAVELVRLMMQRLAESGLRHVPSGGIVLTGGASALTGLVDIVADYGRCPVRIGAPSAALGLPDDLTTPTYSTAIGLLLWSMRQRHAALAANAPSKAAIDSAASAKSGGWFSRFRSKEPAHAGA